MSKKENEVSLAVLDQLTTIEEYQVILDSGAIPSSLDTPQKLMTVVQTGKELGMPPMVAINNINVIKGRTVISSAMLAALLKQHGYEFIYTKDFHQEKDEDGDTRITTELEIEWLSKLGTGRLKTAKFAVTWAEMERAGYTEKQNWEKYPKNMMRARCMAYAVRALCPEILLGIYTDLEIVDAMDTDHTVQMNEEGDVVIDTDHEVVEGD
jgi:hypothetical protein